MEIIINIPEEIKRRFDYEYYVDGEISKYTTDTILQIITDGFIKLNELKQKQEPKTGHWINIGLEGEIDGQIVQSFSCSECGAISIFRIGYRKLINSDLCPNCGAKMVEPQESEG